LYQKTIGLYLKCIAYPGKKLEMSHNTPPGCIKMFVIAIAHASNTNSKCDM